jgi:predicted dithiol-disulfide oxidoreductase (DUF899 family)
MAVKGPAGTLPRMAKPPVVSAEQWQEERDRLLVAEKAATRQEDAVAALRRRLPMVKFRNDYAFEGPDGKRSLLELFGKHDQLVIYQFMDRGPDAYCPGCTWFTDNVPLTGLNCLDRIGVSWATVSNMPIEQIQRYKTERGWTLPFYSSHGNGFSDDCGAGEGFLLNIFYRDGDEVYRTYSTTQRGVDRLVFANSFQDLLPFGRREEWEDSPEGWPQQPTYG